MTDRLASSRFQRARTAAVVILVLLAGLGLALFSTAPSVASQKRPTAEDIAAARELINQVKTSQEQDAPLRLSLDGRKIGAIAILAGEASGLRRVEAEVDADLFSARASVPVTNGLWINTVATVAGTYDGFPAIHLKIGRIALPAVVSRWSAAFIRLLLLNRGVNLPPLDDVVGHFGVAEDRVIVELALPQRGGLVEHMVSAAGVRVDDRLVARIYCRLARTQADERTPPLTSLVQQAFQDASGPDVAMYNRAAFVALAFYVVGEQVRPLAPSAAEKSRSCPPPADGVLLRERADLAKHWTFSAALTAILGEQTAANLGEWKELQDSLPSGSGFSFVDLAADRSGLHVARRALNPGTAESTARALATVSEADLLPEALASAPEGLSENEFVGRFGSLDEKRYREVVSRIDRYLAHWGP